MHVDLRWVKSSMNSLTMDVSCCGWKTYESQFVFPSVLYVVNVVFINLIHQINLFVCLCSILTRPKKLSGQSSS